MNFNGNSVSKLNTVKNKYSRYSRTAIHNSQNPVFKDNVNGNRTTTTTTTYHNNYAHARQMHPFVAALPRCIAPQLSAGTRTTTNNSSSSGFGSLASASGNTQTSNNLALPPLQNVATTQSAIIKVIKPDGLSHNNTITNDYKPLPDIGVVSVPASKKVPDAQLFTLSIDTKRVHQLWRLDSRNARKWKGETFRVSQKARLFGCDPTSNTSFVISDI